MAQADVSGLCGTNDKATYDVRSGFYTKHSHLTGWKGVVPLSFNRPRFSVRDREQKTLVRVFVEMFSSGKRSLFSLYNFSYYIYNCAVVGTHKTCSLISTAVVKLGVRECVEKAVLLDGDCCAFVLLPVRRALMRSHM